MRNILFRLCIKALIKLLHKQTKASYVNTGEYIVSIESIDYHRLKNELITESIQEPKDYYD